MSLLYVSVGLSSIFFTIWLMAYFALFQFSAVAEPVDKQEVTDATNAVDAAVIMKAEEKAKQAKAMADIKAKQAAVASMNAEEAKRQDPAIADAAKVHAQAAIKEAQEAKQIAEEAEAAAAKVNGMHNTNDSNEKDSSVSISTEQKSDVPVDNNSSAIQTRSLDNVASKDQAPKNPNESVASQDSASKNPNESVASQDPVPKNPNESVDNTTKKPETESTNPASSVAQESSHSPTDDSPSASNAAHREVSSTKTENVDDIPAPPSTETQLPQQQVSDKKQKKPSSLLDSARQLQQRITQLITVAKNPYNVDIQGRNPFKSFIEKTNAKKEKVIALTPPEKYALGKMKLVGIKWGIGLTPPTALFRAPDGTLFHLRKNDRIGEARGIVYRIREDEVVIVQPKSGSTPDQDTLYTPIIVSLSRHRTKTITRSVKQ